MAHLAAQHVHAIDDVLRGDAGGRELGRGAVEAAAEGLHGGAHQLTR